MSKFNELINGNVPVLVDFHAEWCGPCKTMAPVLKQIAPIISDKAKILKVDIDKNPSVAQKYGVRGVPTFILFKNGGVKWRQSGMMEAQQLIDVINQFSI